MRLTTGYVFLSGAILVAVLLSQSAPVAYLSIPPLKPSAKPAPIDPVNFREVTLDWRVAASHQQSSKHLTTLTESLGSGVCVIDINNDGWMDLFFVGGSGHTRPYGKASWWSKSTGNRLLLNKQGHHFDDVTKVAGLNSPSWGMSCAVGDLNNDGLSDLIIAGVSGSQLFKNNGNMSFTNVTSSSGIIKDSWSTGASLADFNGDGLLDFYVSNYIQFKKGALTFERTSGFRPTTDIAFDQTLYDPEPNRLYLNKGNFQFDEVAKKMGVADSLGRSLGAKWFDFNKDSWPDLLVINDDNSPNQVYINKRGEAFKHGSEHYAAFEVLGAHDVVINDFDNDALNEFYMTRSAGNPAVMLSPRYLTSVIGNADELPLAQNKKPLSYTDTAWKKGVAQTHLLPFSGWASTAADFNNDGFLDLYVANGVTSPDIDSHFVAQAQANHLFINDRQGGFESQKPDADMQYPSSSRGVISVDLDNDGHMEVLVSNNNDALQIFKNEMPINNWIGLDFSALLKEADIYGSIVTVKTETQVINRILQAPQQFLSQGDGRVHFGLGGNQKFISVSINWRDGSQSEFDIPDVNKYYIVDKEADTIEPKEYVVKTSLHFNDSLATYSEGALMKLTQLLINVIDPMHNDDDLNYIWGIAPTSVRTEIIKQIMEYWHQGDRSESGYPYLSIIKRALSDPSDSIRIKAINILKFAELEISVRWLIPRLADESVAVQCAAAETFGFFFEEEEAVTHRKMLALSSLINLLESKFPKAVVCAANALAAAENRRAVIPLMELAKKHDNSEVKVSAIQALGLISDAKAITLLHQLVNDSASTVQVVGAGLIALVRLNDPAIDEIFASFFADTQQESMLLRHYDTLNYLLSITGGIVFPKAKLENELTRLIKRHKLKKIESRGLQQKIILAKLKAIAASMSSMYEADVLSLISSSDEAIKIQALLTLGFLDTRSGRDKFGLYLLQQKPVLIRTVLEKVVTNQQGISSNLIEVLFKRKDTSQAALLLLKALPVKDASRLLGSLLAQTLNTQQYLSLLSVCGSSELVPDSINNLFWSNIPEELHLQALDCILQAKPNLKTGAIISTVRYDLKNYSMMKNLLSNTTWHRNTKTEILIKSARNNKIIAREILAKKLSTLPEEWLLPALEALANTGEIENAKDFLWVLYKDSRRNWEVRLQAALLLAMLDDRNKHQQRLSEVNTAFKVLEKDLLISNKAEVVNYFYKNFAK
jgi:hypothetical protein